MKKIALTLITAPLLTACADSGTAGVGGLLGGGAGTSSAAGIGKSAVQMYVQNRCVNELQARTEWRTIALAMSQAKQTEWENKICGCISEEAPSQMSGEEMIQVINPATRSQAVTNVAVKTVSACFNRIMSR